jgi:hypothetical protein
VSEWVSEWDQEKDRIYTKVKMTVNHVFYNNFNLDYQRSVRGNKVVIRNIYSSNLKAYIYFTWNTEIFISLHFITDWLF